MNMPDEHGNFFEAHVSRARQTVDPNVLGTV